MGGVDPDLIIRSGKAVQEPFLALAAILATPDLANQFGRQIIGDPVMGLGNRLHQIGGDPGFFPQFAQRGGAGGFPLVDAALGHLPGLLEIVEPLARKDQPFGVDQRDAHAGAVGQVFRFDHDM